MCATDQNDQRAVIGPGGEPGPVRQAFRVLLPCSLAYLALPVVLFLIGWLKWFFGVPAALAVVAALVVECAPRRSDDTVPASGWLPPAIVLAVSVCVLAVVLWFSGIGGAAPQSEDWLKHNALLRALIGSPWPAAAASPHGAFPIVYYTAYYLPAALVGKLAGFNAANHFLFLWSLAGMVIVAAWLFVLFGRFSLLPLACFLLFSGLDVPGLLVVSHFHENPFRFQHNLEVWAQQWQYESTLYHLFMAPQTAVGGWILTALTIHGVRRGAFGRDGILVLSLSTLWCPFITLGLFPLLVVDLLADRERPWRQRLRAYLTIPNLAGAVVGVPILFYYLAKLGPSPFSGGMPAGLVFFSPVVPVSPLEIFGKLVSFCLFEFGVYVMVIVRVERPRGSRERAIFLAAVTTLLVLPFFRFGYYNDLAMRASVPALFLLMLAVARVIGKVRGRDPWRILMVGLLLVGALTPYIEVRDQVRRLERSPISITKVRPNEAGDLWTLHATRYGRRFNFFGQYVGRPDSIFFRYLARRPSSKRP